MNDEHRRKLNRLLLKADTRQKYERGRNLAEIRQWYYQLESSEKQEFKAKLQALAKAAEQFSGAFMDMTVTLHLQQTWHSQDPEGESVSLTADATPTDVLAALAAWDEADEQEWTLK